MFRLSSITYFELFGYCILFVTCDKGFLPSLMLIFFEKLSLFFQRRGVLSRSRLTLFNCVIVLYLVGLTYDLKARRGGKIWSFKNNCRYVGVTFFLQNSMFRHHGNVLSSLSLMFRSMFIFKMLYLICWRQHETIERVFLNFLVLDIHIIIFRSMLCFWGGIEYSADHNNVLASTPQ